MLAVEIAFWVCLGALLWTHVLYPVVAAAIARVRPRPVGREDVTPSVTLIVPAHDEEDVIAGRLENLLALDYPAQLLEIVVGSDASTDRTDAIVEETAAREPRVRLVRCPRGGKLATINRLCTEGSGDLLAFTDANTRWEPDALRQLVRAFADPEVGYATGRLVLQAADGTNREGVYWRYELWLRASESALGSITGGNGAIYAVRRSAFEAQPYGQDAVLPALMAGKRLRAVYDADAVAYEKPAANLEDEFGRKARMFRWSWYHLLAGRPTRGAGLLFRAQWFSHRTLRYGSGILHVGLLPSSIALLGEGWVYRVVLALQLVWLALAALGRLRVPIPGAGLAYYYLLVTWATIVGLTRYLRGGIPGTWERAPGTR
jgi:cellulose synthase/poly-beta-1,6-N-acetylglucosamine synthase-like glycosyltransferase